MCREQFGTMKALLLIFLTICGKSTGKFLQIYLFVCVCVCVCVCVVCVVCVCVCVCVWCVWCVCVCVCVCLHACAERFRDLKRCIGIRNNDELKFVVFRLLLQIAHKTTGFNWETKNTCFCIENRA